MIKPWSKEGKILEQVPIRTKYGTKLGGRWKSAAEKPGARYFPKAAVPGEKIRAYTWHEIKEKHSREHVPGSFSEYLHKYFTPYSRGDSTSSIYHGDRTRHALRNGIVADVVNYANTPPEGTKPIAVLMGGGAASGKSFVRDTLIQPALEAGGVRVGICDPDDMKTRLPEWEYLNETDPAHAGSITHKESVKLANQAFYELMSQGKNLLFDNSMRVVGEYRKKIRALHENGYNVIIIGVTTDIGTALDRAHKRERRMPDGKLRETHSGFSTAWEFIKDYADDFKLYDSTSGELELVEDIHGVRNPDLMEAFHDRGKNGERRRRLRGIADANGADLETLWDMYRGGMSFDEIEQILKGGGTE